MIYLVTKNCELSTTDDYSIISVEESLTLLDPLAIVGLDTETTGLNCWTDKLKSIQLGSFNFQVVIDCCTIDPKEYKSYLESDRLFIGANIKFDLCFLYRQSIWPKNVFDVYLAEKLMWLGYPIKLNPEAWNRIQCKRYTPIYSKTGEVSNYLLEMNLKKLGSLYLGVELDKSIRGKIIYEGLTTEVIVYSANDVKYLQPLKEAQEKELLRKNLLIAMQYENAFVLALAYMEYCGIKLDVDKWKIKMEADKKREIEAINNLNKWLINNLPKSKYISRDLQGDLFSGFSIEPKVTVNWNSSTQLIPIFKELGINVEDSEGDGSLNAKILAPQASKSPLIPIYLDYKEAVKLTSTYGQNFIDQINKVSGRIHTKYQQMGADTTRITSGGKEPNGRKLVNLLNIPADSNTRACFVAEEGNQWISIDYSGQESFIMASIANDAAMIKELTEGSKDLHSLTAKMVFDEIPKDFPVVDIKKEYPHLRQQAKGYEFAFNYAGNDMTIMRNFGLDSKAAKTIYDNYMKGFSGLRDYQAFRKKDWMDKGYILLSSKTGHKAYIYDHNILCSGKRDDMSGKRKSSSNRQSVNYPIQATGSMCLRVSMITFFKFIRDNGLLDIVKICVAPYDEINCEAPKEIAQNIVETLHSCMVRAGAYFCTRCKLDADISYLKNGGLPTYWIH